MKLYPASRILSAVSKRWRFLACSLLVSLTLGGAGRAATLLKSGPPERKPTDLAPVTWLQVPSHPPVEIVRDGVAKAVVYVPDPKTRALLNLTGRNKPVFKQMFDQLVETVGLTTGVELPVVTNAPAADQPAIVIGDCEESRKAGIVATNLPVEGFVVKTAPNRVYLVGSARGGDGTAWAVADFLERFVGVRWYWPTPYGG
ncbi:MAG: hypothetical protein WCS01_17225, partial [bacterium]